MLNKSTLLGVPAEVLILILMYAGHPQYVARLRQSNKHLCDKLSDQQQKPIIQEYWKFIYRRDYLTFNPDSSTFVNYQALYKKAFEKERMDLSCERKPKEIMLLEWIRSGDLASIKKIPFNEISLNDVENYNGETAIYLAALGGHFKIVKFLVEKGVELDQKNRNGKTALHGAVLSGNLEIVNFLIAQKVKIDSTDNSNNSPCYYAVQKGYVEIFNALKNAKADINIVNNHNKTMLFTASKHGHLQIVKNLIAEKVDLEKGPEFQTPLLIALEEKHIDVALALIEAGADVNALNKHDDTPLIIAVEISVEMDCSAVIAALVAKKALLNQSNAFGKIPLGLAIEYELYEVVDLLIKSGADVNYANNDLQTPIFMAAKTNNIDIAKLLIANKPDLNKKDKNGETPLFCAIRIGNYQMVQFLLLNGVTFDLACNNKNALMLSEEIQNSQIYTFLKLWEVKLKNKDVSLRDQVIAILETSLPGNSASVKSKLFFYKSSKNIIDALKNLNCTKQTIIPFLKDNMYYIPEEKYCFIFYYILQKHFDISPELDMFGAEIKTRHVRESARKNTPIEFSDKFFPYSKKPIPEDILLLILIYTAHPRYLGILRQLNKTFNTILSDLQSRNKLNIYWQTLYTNFLINKEESKSVCNEPRDLFKIGFEKRRLSHKHLTIQQRMLFEWILANDLQSIKGRQWKVEDFFSIAYLKYNAISLATFAKRYAILKYLYEIAIQQLFSGSDFTCRSSTAVKDSGGRTELYLAAAFGQHENIDMIKHKYIVDEPNNNRQTPLGIASMYGHTEVVRVLIQMDANVNLKTREHSPINCAVKYGHYDIIPLLVGARADINVVDDKFTPLITAIQIDSLKMVKFLLSLKADVNKSIQGFAYPLHIAAIKGNKDIVQTLIDANAIVDSPARNGETPLLVAIHYGNIETAKLLISKSRNINQTGQNGDTALHTAVAKDQVELIQPLLNKGANINLMNNTNSTPLSLAVEKNNFDLVKLFINNGANINVVNRAGESLEQVANRLGYKSIVLLLKLAAIKEQAKNQPLNSQLVMMLNVTNENEQASITTPGTFFATKQSLIAQIKEVKSESPVQILDMVKQYKGVINSVVYDFIVEFLDVPVLEPAAKYRKISHE